MPRKILFFICFIFCAFLLGQQAFSSQVFDSKKTAIAGEWEAIWQAMAKENYPEAIRKLKRIVAPADGVNKFSPHAEATLGLAYLKNGQIEEAEKFFLLALEKNAEKELAEEINYWLAEIAVGRKRFSTAYDKIKVVNSKANSYLRKHFKQERLIKAPMDTLMRLADQHPEDKGLVELIGKKFFQTPADYLNLRKKISQLAHQHNLLALQNQLNDKSFNKSFNVAVFLPLDIDSKKNQTLSQAMVDLYEGFREASFRLSEKGINLNLKVLDTKRSEAVVKKHLEDPALQEVDLIVGPVFAQGAAELAKFAQEHTIPMVNPLTNRVYWDTTNKYAILGEARWESVAERALEWSSQFTTTKKAGILYGATTPDSLIAMRVKKGLEARGLKVPLFRKIGKLSAGNLPKFLLQAELDSTSFIYCPNDDPTVMVQTIASLSAIRLRIPVLAAESWLNQGSYDLERWESSQVSFIFPHHKDPEGEPYRNFRKAYAERVKLPPSTIALQGFELLNLCGELLAEYGQDFPKELKSVEKRGIIMGGFDYSNSSDNKYLPIVKIRKGELVYWEKP